MGERELQTAEEEEEEEERARVSSRLVELKAENPFTHLSLRKR